MVHGGKRESPSGDIYRRKNSCHNGRQLANCRFYYQSSYSSSDRAFCHGFDQLYLSNPIYLHCLDHLRTSADPLDRRASLDSLLRKSFKDPSLEGTRVFCCQSLSKSNSFTVFG